MSVEKKYLYRKKQLSYEEFVNGPGSKMSTSELEAALDKASGATKTRRALQRAMTGSGYKMISAGADGVSFKGEKGELHFDTFGDVEKYLLEQGAIKDEKAEAVKAAAEKKEKERAKKAAAAKKIADKKAADKAKAAAKKQAQKAKAAAAKKTAATKKASAAKKPASRTVAKTVATGRKTATGSSAGTAAKTTGRKPGRPAKNAAVKGATGRTAARTGGRKMTGRAPVALSSKNLQEDGFVVRIGNKEYTQKRIRSLALDVYKYDLGGDVKSVKKIETYIRADEKKCQFIVNGKERGEFNL